MIDHLSIYATDYSRTKAFYETAFAPLGYTLQMEFVAEWNQEFPTQRLCAYGPEGRPVFWIVETKDSHTPNHIAFSSETRSGVDAFYEAGLKSGGTDNGAPGLRPMYSENYYGAFLIDPDGNNVEAVCHKPE